MDRAGATSKAARVVVERNSISCSHLPNSISKGLAYVDIEALFGA